MEEDETKSEDEEPTLARTARVGHPKPSQCVQAAPPAPDAAYAKAEICEARGAYY